MAVISRIVCTVMPGWILIEQSVPVRIFSLASDGAYSGAVEQIIEEQIEKSCQADIREGLQISELQKKMHTKEDVLEYEYNIGKQGGI